MNERDCVPGFIRLTRGAQDANGIKQTWQVALAIDVIELISESANDDDKGCAEIEIRGRENAYRVQETVAEVTEKIRQDFEHRAMLAAKIGMAMAKGEQL